MLEVRRFFEGRVVPVQFLHPAAVPGGNRNHYRIQRDRWKLDDVRVDSGVSVSDGSDVALEMADIDRIKANLFATNMCWKIVKCQYSEKTHDGDPEPDICFSQHISDKIVFSSQNLFKPVKGIKNWDDSFLVSSLSYREAGFIYTV